MTILTQGLYHTTERTNQKILIGLHYSQLYVQSISLPSCQINFAFNQLQRQIIHSAFTWMSSLSDFNVVECVSQ